MITPPSQVANKFACIVCDPPWHYAEGWPAYRPTLGVVNDGRRTALKYPSLSVAAIAALPVKELTDAQGCHLYLWTTNRYLRDAFGVVEAWGFRYSQLLVWAKTPMGCGPGGAFAQNAEYVIFARRGTLKHKKRLDSVWYNWPRTAKHSKKPEHFLDMVETVSPGPYLEMFSRRHRLGWDVWGNQVESSIEVAV